VVPQEPKPSTDPSRWGAVLVAANLQQGTERYIAIWVNFVEAFFTGFSVAARSGPPPEMA